MVSQTERQRWIDILRQFPDRLDSVVGSLTPEQLHTHAPHDPWTVAQLVHHCADSHMNSFIRLKLTLTEDRPPLKPYEQDIWVTMADEAERPIAPSMQILRGLHHRWVEVFEAVTEAEWQRVGMHMEDGEMTVLDMLRNYAQHCEDHMVQIQQVLAAQ